VNHQGFTLIELMIVMVISIIVIGGTIQAYQSQQNAQLAQKQVVEMQQNLRAALYFMSRDIRMAGYDPDDSHGAGITSAGDGSNSTNRLIFTYFKQDAGTDGNDNDNDGTNDEPGESLQAVEYYLYDFPTSNPDDDLDIGRRYGARLNVIAENIASLQFTYLDSAGNAMSSPITLSDIRSIQITIQATTDNNVIDHTGGNNRTLSTIVKCRNLGL